MPLHVGNQWQYDAHYHFYATYITRGLEGGETWNLTFFNETYQTAQIQCTFNGFEFEYDSIEETGDTTFIDNAATYFTIEIEDEYLLIKKRENLSSKPSVWSFITNFLDEKGLIVLHPYNIPDPIEGKWGGGDQGRQYKIDKKIGLLYFAGYNLSVFGGNSIKYNLIDSHILNGNQYLPFK